MESLDLPMRFGAALVVFGLLALFLWLLRRYRDRYLYGIGMGNGSADPVIQLRGEINLGLRQRVVLLRVEGRSLVLAVGPDRIHPLGEWEAKEPAHASA
jgi:flagellar biogenesis protein FliO